MSYKKIFALLWSVPRGLVLLGLVPRGLVLQRLVLPGLALTLLSGCTLWGSKQQPANSSEPELTAAIIAEQTQADDEPAQTQPAPSSANLIQPGTSETQTASVEPAERLVQTEQVQRSLPAIGLQLGAFSEPQGAVRALQRLQRGYPLVFENRTPIIRAFERDGTKLYRVILGPFSEREIAESFCTLLKQGGEVCFPTRFDRVDLRVERKAEIKEE